MTERNAPPDVRRIEIASITVPPRLRPVDDAWASILASSFEAIGQNEPIIVNFPDAVRVPDFPDSGDLAELVIGGHRLAAAGKCGWPDIDARLIAVSRDQARLMEIDENLIRNDLSALDRAVGLLERQAVWEKLYPETKRGGRRGNQHIGGQVRQTANLSFSQDAAEKCGLSARTVRRAIAMARSLSPEVREQLRGQPIADNQAQLQALSKLAPDLQSKAATAIAKGDAKTVQVALSGRGPARRDGFVLLARSWTLANTGERKRFLVWLGVTDVEAAKIARDKRK